MVLQLLALSTNAVLPVPCQLPLVVEGSFLSLESLLLQEILLILGVCMHL